MGALRLFHRATAGALALSLALSLAHAASAAAPAPPPLESLASAWQPRNETVGNMPTVSNFWGSATPSTDPLDAMGLDVFDTFPYVGWLRTRLSARDASGASVLFAPNASRWLATRSERRAYASGGGGGDFSAVTAEVAHRFLFESPRTLITLTLRNDGAAPVRLGALQLSLTSGVRLVPEMAWVVPLPTDDGSWACTGYASAPNVTSVFFMDSISRAREVIGTVPPPTSSTGGGAPPSCWANLFYGDIVLPSGGSWTLNLGLVPDTSLSNATASLNSLLADPVGAAAASDAAWDARWLQAFTPGSGHYSGNAPLLTVPEGDAGAAAVASFYYMSVLTVISLERVSWRQSALFADCPRLYPIGQEGLSGGGAPAGRPLGGSAFWIWDEGYASLVLSLLDPDAVRAYVRAIIRAVNISTTNAFDLVSGEAILPWPDGFGGGGFYAYNAIQLFTMASQYVTATNDTAFLDERVGGPAAPRVADKLLELALHWQSFDADGDLLVEYSDDDGNYLECVPHYRGAVAGLQGGNVFMMRSVADMIDRLYPGDALLGPWPAQLRALAANMSAVTRARLYVAGEGEWAAFVSSASPQLAPVPTVLDFAHVARFLRADLSAAQRSESSEFFLSRLLLPEWTGWLRALAVPDGDYSQRADHGTTGAYTTWASLSAEALAFNDGSWSRAVGLFARFSPALRLGPLGQAGQVEVIGNSTSLHPVFKAPEWPFAQICGANFADVILRSLFGFSPQWAPTSLAGIALSPPLAQGGFVGSLAHVRTPLGRLATVTSDGTALAWVLE